MRQNLQTYLKKYANTTYLKKLLFDPHYVTLPCYILLILEVILNVFIIENVKYTEIDWKAYMQEVEGFINGTWDYKELKGTLENVGLFCSCWKCFCEFLDDTSVFVLLSVKQLV